MERTITLAPATWAALDQIAGAERISVAEIVRDAVHRDLYRRKRAAKAERPDERLLAPLRALLADDFACAKGWNDLLARLMHKGYRLAEAGPGLILVSHSGGDKVCKASDLGYSHARLAGGFGTAFPAHAHAHTVLRR